MADPWTGPDKRPLSPESSEANSFIEQCRTFILKTKTLGQAAVRRPAYSASFVDFITGEEIDQILGTVVEYWKGRLSLGHLDESDIPQIVVEGAETKTDYPVYVGLEQMVDSILVDLSDRKLPAGDDRRTAADAKSEAKPATKGSAAAEPLDDEPSLVQIMMPELRSTDVLELLLRVYAISHIKEKYENLDVATEDAATASSVLTIRDFRRFLLSEMNSIYYFLVGIHTSSSSESSRTPSRNTDHGSYQELRTRSPMPPESPVPYYSLYHTVSDIINQLIYKRERCPSHVSDSLSGITSIRTDTKPSSVSSMSELKDEKREMAPPVSPRPYKSISVSSMYDPEKDSYSFPTHLKKRMGMKVDDDNDDDEELDDEAFLEDPPAEEGAPNPQKSAPSPQKIDDQHEEPVETPSKRAKSMEEAGDKKRKDSVDDKLPTV